MLTRQHNGQLHRHRGWEKTNKQTEERRQQNQFQKKRKACHLNATVITITQQKLTAGGTALTMKQSCYRMTKYQRPLSSRNKRAIPELTVGCSW